MAIAGHVFSLKLLPSLLSRQGSHWLSWHTLTSLLSLMLRLPCCALTGLARGCGGRRWPVGGCCLACAAHQLSPSAEAAEPVQPSAGQHIPARVPGCVRGGLPGAGFPLLRSRPSCPWCPAACSSGLAAMGPIKPAAPPPEQGPAAEGGLAKAVRDHAAWVRRSLAPLLWQVAELPDSPVRQSLEWQMALSRLSDYADESGSASLSSVLQLRLVVTLLRS